MEFGALICRPRNPDCPACPLAQRCAAGAPGHRGRPAAGLSKSKDITPLNVATGVLIHGGRIFIQKRLPKRPGPICGNFPAAASKPARPRSRPWYVNSPRKRALPPGSKTKLAVIRHGYTTYRVTLHCCLLRLTDAPEAAPPPNRP